IDHHAESGSTENKDDNENVNIYQATEWVEAKSQKFADYTAENNGMAWYVENFGFSVDPNADGHSHTVYKLKSAELSIKSGVQFYIALDDNGYWRKDADGNYVPLSDTKPEDGKYKCIVKNVSVDLTEFIPVDSSMVTHDYNNADLNNVLDGTDCNDLCGWNCEVVGSWAAIPFTKVNDFEDEGLTSAGVPAPYRTNLKDAMRLSELYMGTDKDAIKNDGFLYYLDTPDAIPVGTAKGSSAEWTIVYRYLRYALADKYDADRVLYTKADVEKLIEDCYELAELTGDASLFSVNHNFLVDARQNALEWVKAANKDKKYKDNYSVADLCGEDKTSTAVYNYLNFYYKKLKSDYDNFKYSFEQVYMAIADTKAAIDDGELEGTESMLAALEEVSYRLSVVGCYSEEDGENAFDNDAFTSDRFFQEFNRVFTGGGDYALPYDAVKTTPGDTVQGSFIGPDGDKFILETIKVNAGSAISGSHTALKNAYEALLAEVKKQQEVTTLLGDVNGDGVVNALDAAEILKAAVNNTVIDVAVGDFNADGTVNALDASAILKYVVGLA
ncbi:MAG: dockerin type I repeat-containing protein, partial [Oscillospiraceae bacterium]